MEEIETLKDLILPKTQAIINDEPKAEKAPYFTKANVGVDELTYIVGGWDGYLTEWHLNGSSRVLGKTVEFENTSWIAPAREGMLIAN